MVKNTTGGSKHKGQARKNVVTNRSSTALRLAQNELELYAHVEKILGGANIHVMCMDGKLRLCHIRGKFRGRGKRDNIIQVGTWVIVGLRDYETMREGSTKLENCDLLEVYRDSDKDRLRNTVRADWSGFVSRDMERAHQSKDVPGSDLLRFVTDEEEEMDKFVAESAGLIEEEMATMDSDESDDSSSQSPAIKVAPLAASSGAAKKESRDKRTKVIQSSSIIGGFGGGDDDIDIDDI